ncbi:GntR family transcriptional regulator [Mangrovactinospora gilvigrisea]|uniref:GntR family transcriptional regulator n=1 Tax=Mangrovactinospora gilvigrisea TaxID=1428644 RepID=UPI000AB63490|nr:GntR family transcriptional regulator [Mangrovactinospora gilvigrisea]
MGASDETYEALLERIVEGGLRPGQRMVERDLAAELGVSRVPVREALRRLSVEGLVVLVPRQGALVAPFTPADVEDLFDVRERLEGLAARRAAERADADDLAALGGLLDAARAARDAGDERDFARANAGFHLAVVRASGNALLEQMTAPLAQKLRWLFRLTADRDGAQQCAEHAALLAAVSAGDADRAEALAREHAASGRAESIHAASAWADPDFDPVTLTKTRRRTRT